MHIVLVGETFLTYDRELAYNFVDVVIRLTILHKRANILVDFNDLKRCGLKCNGLKWRKELGGQGNVC